MLVAETVSVAFQSIRANKLRAALTMLGIIIGVGAVITMVALGSGAQKSVEDRINALGANLLSILPGQSFMGGFASTNRVSLTTDDAAALDSSATTLAAVVPELSGNFQIKYGNQNFNLSVTGTTPNYIKAHNYTITYGQMFTRGDDDGRQRYAILGAALPDEWGQNPVSLLHQMIHIRGIPFEIVGILSAKGAQGFNNPDEQILIPLETAKYRIFGSNRLRTISVQVKDSVPLDLAMVDIERVMRRKHKILPGRDNDFQIRNQADILATQQQATQVFTALLASIAAVSLIVGGIGIMNIMLVSVTERTKEIGIRKALGASRGTILFQFLIEALVLCLTGGGLGILLGVVGAVVLAKAFSWNILISPVAITIAFAFSGAVGLFFGLWPAKRAASLDPVEALRYE
jgi:putative ABC transport system permease protein